MPDPLGFDPVDTVECFGSFKPSRFPRPQALLRSLNFLSVIQLYTEGYMLLERGRGEEAPFWWSNRGPVDFFFIPYLFVVVCRLRGGPPTGGVIGVQSTGWSSVRTPMHSHKTGWSQTRLMLADLKCSLWIWTHLRIFWQKRKRYWSYIC